MEIVNYNKLLSVFYKYIAERRKFLSEAYEFRLATMPTGATMKNDDLYVKGRRDELTDLEVMLKEINRFDSFVYDFKG